MRKPTGTQFNSPFDDVAVPMANAVGVAIADARERASMVPIKIGHPQGQLSMPMLRGKFWGQRMQADGSSVVVDFYAPTDADGKPLADFKVGDAAIVEFSSDTNPGHWVYRQHASAGDDVGGLAGPPFGCSNSPTGKFWWPGSGVWPGPNGETEAGPNNPFPGVRAQHPPTSPAPKSFYTPIRSAQPPTQPSNGVLWQDTADNTTYSYQGTVDINGEHGKWYVQSGPISGVYVTRRAVGTISRGQVVYEDPTAADGADRVLIASNTVMACKGRVLGVATQNRTDGQYIVIQCAGDFRFDHAYSKGTILYLDTAAGNVTGTAPVSGSGKLRQQIAIAGNNTTLTDSFWHIKINEAIKLL